MRVLAVTQLLRQAAGQNHRLGKDDGLLARHPFGDRRIVGCRHRERFARERSPEIGADRPVAGGKRGEHAFVIGRVGDYRHGIVVFRSGADHGDAPNVDIFYARLGARARCDRLREGVEVADEKVDWGDAAFRQRGEMIRLLAPGQKAAMNGRVQCLDPAVEELCSAGDLCYLGDRQSGGHERARRSACRDECDAARRERAGERDNPGLVADRNEGASDEARVGGHRHGIRLCRQLRQSSAAPAEADEQGRYDRDRGAERDLGPAVLCSPAAADEQDIGGDDALDNGGVAEAASYRPLVIVPAMRLPDPLAAQQASHQSDRRIRQKIERPDQRDLPEAAESKANPASAPMPSVAKSRTPTTIVTAWLAASPSMPSIKLNRLIHQTQSNPIPLKTTADPGHPSSPSCDPGRTHMPSATAAHWANRRSSGERPRTSSIQETIPSRPAASEIPATPGAAHPPRARPSQANITAPTNAIPPPRGVGTLWDDRSFG